jgi:NAD(P)H dehydrogenase (quinone)
MILITGATGQLGRKIIHSLMNKGTPANQIVAGARTVEKANNLAEQGVIVRHFDYNNPTSLTTALVGVKRMVLVSSSEVGQRATQHENVINAAKQAQLELVAYTSLLKASTSSLALAKEHVLTEQALRKSGLAYALLRNSWYSENYTANIVPALEHGAVLGSAKDGKYATASRDDYAEAAAVVITSDNQAGKIYELAGDEAFTLDQYADTLSELANKPVIYQDLPAEEYTQILIKMGLPEAFASLLSDADVGASKGDLYSDSNDLSTLIGRPTTSIKQSIKAALNN